MTMVAPTHKWLQQKVRELANDAFLRGEPRVYYLGAGGKVLVAVSLDEAGRDRLLANRTELLATGQLKAIVEIVPLYPDIIQMSMVEVFTATDSTDVYALVTWPAHQRWIHVPKEAQARWHEHWT